MLAPLSSHASYSYAKAEAVLYFDDVVAIGGGMGHRYEIGEVLGLDVSWAAAVAKTEKVGIYASPRIAGIVYAGNIYVGAGAQWAGVVDLNRNGWFYGIQAAGILGVEFFRQHYLRTFLEVVATMPVTYKENHYEFEGDRPTLSLALGFGF